MASDKIDPQLCQKYAQFASHLDRWHFKILYWTLFITNLLVLFFGSWLYTKYVLRKFPQSWSLSRGFFFFFFSARPVWTSLEKLTTS